MTEPFRGMSDDPGSPENSDPEATSPELAEDAAEEAKAAQDAAADMSAEDLDAELAEVLANSSANQDLDSDGEASSLDAQLAERTEDLQRMTAEYANYRRRTERERSGIVTTAKASVVEKFIPILDDLDLAAQHGDLEEGPLKAFADKFQNIITAQGLAPFGEPGEEFDPEIHEAVQDLSQGDEKVLGTVLRKGYKVGDKVVRTAMVIIADPN